MKNTFFEYEFIESDEHGFTVSRDSEVIGCETLFANEYLKEVVASFPENGKKITLSLSLGYPDFVREKASDKFRDIAESYAVICDGEKIDIYAGDERGLIYGVSTVRMLFASGKAYGLFVFDYPDKPIRGYRVFIPGEKNIVDFKNAVDKLLLYKFNSLIIECGGAMEYERHPEINKKWIEFCEEMHKSPYETDRVEHKTYKWTKNAIHADNGGGSYLSKKQLKELVDYCKYRGFEVIPEVPSLSHCDYLVMAHPEFNERKEDAYPDTYCPSDPGTYELLFDVLDEVIEVFAPKYINIGHDECYTLAKCDLCKGKDPVELYVGDIKKINDYLNGRGILALMWCEKTYEVRLPNGWPIGGTGNPLVDIPRLVDCADKIPKSVILLDWYWGNVGPEEEQRNIDYGHRMFYGNVCAGSIKQYRKRPKEIEGGFASNWGSFEPEYMQRNKQNYMLASTAYVFWSSTFDSDDKPMLLEKIFDVLHEDYRESLGNSLITVRHTCDRETETRSFYDGYYIDDAEWIMGSYEVTYSDGTRLALPVKYGYNIKGKGIEKENADQFIDVVGAAKPYMTDDGMAYVTSYINPYPDKKIVSVEYKPVTGDKVTLIDYITE